MGGVMSDLQGRRAIIMGMESDNGIEKLNAKVPLKEMASYSTSLSSITGGRRLIHNAVLFIRNSFRAAYRRSCSKNMLRPKKKNNSPNLSH